MNISIKNVILLLVAERHGQQSDLANIGKAHHSAKNE
jgi:hypothetical protein